MEKIDITNLIEMRNWTDAIKALQEQLNKSLDEIEALREEIKNK